MAAYILIPEMTLNIETMKSPLLGFFCPWIDSSFSFSHAEAMQECTTHVSFSCVRFFLSLIVGG